VRAETNMTTRELIDILDPHFEPKPYVGRGTEGKTVVSVESDGTAWDEACFREIRGLPSHYYDWLGKGKVYYWPEHEWPSEGDGLGVRR